MLIIEISVVVTTIGCYRIRSLKKEIKQVKEKMDVITLRRQEARIKRKYKRTKRLGKHAYPFKLREIEIIL